MSDDPTTEPEVIVLDTYERRLTKGLTIPMVEVGRDKGVVLFRPDHDDPDDPPVMGPMVIPADIVDGICRYRPRGSVARLLVTISADYSTGEPA